MQSIISFCVLRFSAVGPPRNTTIEKSWVLFHEIERHEEGCPHKDQWVHPCLPVVDGPSLNEYQKLHYDCEDDEAEPCLSIDTEHNLSYHEQDYRTEDTGTGKAVVVQFCWELTLPTGVLETVSKERTVATAFGYILCDVQITHPRRRLVSNSQLHLDLSPKKWTPG